MGIQPARQAAARAARGTPEGVHRRHRAPVRPAVPPQQRQRDDLANNKQVLDKADGEGEWLAKVRLLSRAAHTGRRGGLVTMAAAITNTTHVITRAALISNYWEQLSHVMLYCFSMQVLAAAGVASRRACIDLVKAGAVSVNGTRVSDPATRVSCSRDILSVNGKPVARVCRCAQLHILACGRRWPLAQCSAVSALPTASSVLHQIRRVTHRQCHIGP